MIQQTPWFQRSFHFDFPVGLFPIIFSRIEGSIFRLYSLLSNADDELCSHNANGWSVKEHVGHLYDLEELWWKRLQDFQQGKARTHYLRILNNQKTKEAGHNEKTFEKLVEQFTIRKTKNFRRPFMALMKSLLLTTSVHPG